MFSLRHRSGQAFLLLLVAFLIRSPFYGNPVIHSDEQFYLLVGDRLLHGAWPYVDIFDRKPVGLFLVFAAIRSVGGNGVLMYQLAATLVAAGTAFLVARIVDRLSPAGAGRLAGLGAGMIYLVWIIVFDGAGGQSAVWGNALMAPAALLVLDTTRGHRHISLRGAGSMLLIGMAMQIKYTAMFEGIFFGLTLLWAARDAGRTTGRLAADAALWIGAALLPTALAWAVYAAAGHGDAFVFANFLSIFHRNPDPLGELAGNLGQIVLVISPIVAIASLALHRSAMTRARRFVALWLAVSIAGVIVFRPWFDHYSLPVLLPACAAAAGLLGRDDWQRWRTPALLLTAALAGQITLVIQRLERGEARQFAALSAAVGRGPGCLWVYSGSTMLYVSTARCAPSRYIVPSHLARTREAGATGIDQQQEIRRILAARPAVVVMRPPYGGERPEARAAVMAAMAADYALAAALPMGNETISVYKRLR